MPFKIKSGYKKRVVASKKRVAKAPRRPFKAKAKLYTSVDMGKGFPKQIKFTHKYSDVTSGTSTLGVPSKILWACNGMYDPYIIGIGGQPMYFDQLAVLYDHYVVIGSKCNVIVTGTGVTGPCVTGMFINDDTSTTVGNTSGLCELSQGRFKHFNNQSIPQKFSMSWSVKKTFGGSILANTELQGTPAANPAELSYYTFWLGAMDQASTQTYLVQVQIEYTAIWKELKDIAQS